MMRFHVVSLPHTQTTLAFSTCAYTEKVRKFCMMMKSLGHMVFLYAGDQNEAPCDELITCIDEGSRAAACEGRHYVEASFDFNLRHWRVFNDNVISGIKRRAGDRDFICVIGGVAHKPIADAFPDMMTVEFGIGYGGYFAKYRVWESYAWMHTCYGAATRGQPSSADGAWFDEVIPGYFDPDQFPFDPRSERNYYLYVGRLVERKGFHIAVEVCQRLDLPLILAGPGKITLPLGGKARHVGIVGPEDRAKLMLGAKALFVPTIYVEPFGNVAVEAMACGTPVICTDWGAFTETVISGVTGFRCRMLSEFCTATTKIEGLDPVRIRDHAMSRFSLPVIAQRYDAYFQRLQTLWGEGWYSL